MDIVSCYEPCFALVLAVSEPESQARPSAADALRLRRNLEHSLRQAENAASRLLGPRAARQASRFVAAWADESLLTSDWAGREYWMRAPLHTLCGEGRSAGESFFQELACLHPHAHSQTSSQTISLPLLQVALRCLALGFVGQYHGQPEHLTNIRRDKAQCFGLVHQPRPFPPLLNIFRPPLPRLWRATLWALLLVACLWGSGEYLLRERWHEILAPGPNLPRGEGP